MNILTAVGVRTRVVARWFGAFGIGASLCLSAMAVSAADGGVAQLRQFVATVSAAEGRFEQMVMAGSGRRPQLAEGLFAFERPGRFRWTYAEPYPQLLVSDGQRLWIWDEDLNQATVKELGDALGNTPAAILAGQDALDDAFELIDAGREAGLDWVEATPRHADSGFESVRIGLSDGMLVRMEMRDHFAQTTVIEFFDLDTTTPLDPALFRFEPPPGADVIGE